MNKTVWVFPTLVLTGLLVLLVWIQRGQSQPQPATVVINDAATGMATETGQPDLPTATASSTEVSPTATATSVPSATPTIVIESVLFVVIIKVTSLNQTYSSSSSYDDRNLG